MAQGQQVEGLPTGATLKPIEGLPAGAEVRPIGGQAPPKQPGLTDYQPPRTTPANNFTEGVQEFVRPANNMFSAALKSGGDFAKSLMAPPPQQSVGSRIADVVAGPAQPALHAIRGLVSGARQSYKEGGLDKALTDTIGPPAVGAVGGEMLAKGINAVPRASRANAKFNMLNEKLADQPVKLTKTAPYLQNLAEQDAAGPSMPTTANKLLNRSQAIEPMNYPMARRFQSNLSDLTPDDLNRMNGMMKGGVKQLRGGLFEDIKSAADTKGLGEDYASAMKESRQAHQLKSAAKGLGKVAIGAGGLGAAYGVYRNLRGQ